MTKGFLKNSIHRKNNIQALAMLLPSTAGFLIFSLFPILMVLSWSVYNYDGFSPKVFIGLENFVRLFTRDSRFWYSIYNTFIIAFGKLLIEIPFALILAVLLNQLRKGSYFFKVVFFTPSVVSTAITALIFSMMFASYDGIINGILQTTGLINAPVNWFSNEWTARIVIMLASIWEGFGINMIFFLMALQSVPASLYECSKLDGAGRVRQFFHITLPMIAPITQYVILNAILSSLRMTDLVLVLTNGLPQGRTEVAMTYAFKYFFAISTGNMNQLGYGSALSIVTGILLGILTIIYFKVTKKSVDF
jgi:raffinose/stachyose/melibiose transport system permease protein